MAWHMRSTRSVASSPEIVYRYYTDPSTWGDWAHNTRGATGGLVANAEFRFALAPPGTLDSLTLRAGRSYGRAALGAPRSLTERGCSLHRDFNPSSDHRILRSG